MVKEIAKYGARVLREISLPVDKLDDRIQSLIGDLFDSMRAAEGVGLAAPQIGVLKRVIVVDVSRQEPQHSPVALVNPRIISASGFVIGEEGCLSFPDLYSEVKRHAIVEIEALEASGEPLRFVADGFYARVLQHEIDHLDGRLFIDHLSPLKRQLMRSPLKRLKKEGESWNQKQAMALARGREI